MTVAQYAEWWAAHHNQQPAEDTDTETSLLYLKDWKFVETNPKNQIYEWPIYFRDDWLNGATGNAYKFV